MTQSSRAILNIIICKLVGVEPVLCAIQLVTFIRTTIVWTREKTRIALTRFLIVIPALGWGHGGGILLILKYYILFRMVTRLVILRVVMSLVTLV